MSDAEDNTKTVDRESKESKDKTKEDGGHVDNQVKTEDGKDDVGKNKEKVTPNKKNAKTKPQKKEEKIEVKEKVNQEDDEDDEDDDEDDDDDGENDTNGKVPLLDQPLQISGTRDRKKVQRFSEEFKPIPKESVKCEIPEGRGTQLGEIPRIEASIQKSKVEELKPLHKILFKGVGKMATLRRNIRKFNGFDFKEGSEQYVKKRASITKIDMATLKGLSRTLDLTTGGSRDEIVTRLLNFLMEPKESDKSVKESKKKKSSSSTKKAKSQKTNSSKGKKKKAESEDEASSEAEMETEDKDEDDGDVDDDKESSEEEEKDSENEKDESEDDSKKKVPAKKKPAANARKPAPKKAEQKKEPENKKAEVKPTEKKKRKEAEMKSDDESSEDEPLLKKTKQPPTDDEIKSYVKQILEGANLEEITMKTVCKQVYAAYPEFDLAHKKDFIKSTVKSLIST